MNLKLEKKRLRKFLLSKALSLREEEIKCRSSYIKKNLCSLPIYRNSKTIVGYYPLKGEVDILGMMKEALSQNKRVCLPVIDLKNNRLIPFEVKDLNDVCVGPFGIREPNIKNSRKIDIEEIDIVITPAVAFDYKKNRLGRGKGFYDSFLKKLSKNTIKIGLAFDFQVLESLPIHTRLDQKVSILVSERFII